MKWIDIDVSFQITLPRPPLYVCVEEGHGAVSQAVAPEEGILVGLPNEVVPTEHKTGHQVTAQTCSES